MKMIPSRHQLVWEIREIILKHCYQDMDKMSYDSADEIVDMFQELNEHIK